MDYWFILYIFIAVGVCLGGMVVLIQSHRTLAGLLFIVGAVLIFVFYGLRWFSGDTLRPTKYSSTTWPPIINVCPDFLSVYTRKVGGNTEQVCVDLIGTSSNGVLQKFIKPDDEQNPAKIFNLSLNKTGADRLKALCKECNEKGVTWEGIWNGTTCLDPSYIPKTDGTKDSTTPVKCN